MRGLFKSEPKRDNLYVSACKPVETVVCNEVVTGVPVDPDVQLQAMQERLKGLTDSLQRSYEAFKMEVESDVKYLMNTTNGSVDEYRRLVQFVDRASYGFYNLHDLNERLNNVLKDLDRSIASRRKTLN